MLIRLLKNETSWGVRFSGKTFVLIYGFQKKKKIIFLKLSYYLGCPTMNKPKRFDKMLEFIHNGRLFNLNHFSSDVRHCVSTLITSPTILIVQLVDCLKLFLSFVENRLLLRAYLILKMFTWLFKYYLK